jgi:hypothetical protein
MGKPWFCWRTELAHGERKQCTLSTAATRELSAALSISDPTTPEGQRSVSAGQTKAFMLHPGDFEPTRQCFTPVIISAITVASHTDLGVYKT